MLKVKSARTVGFVAAAAALLVAGIALALWPAGPVRAQGQNDGPPQVENLGCLAKTDMVRFFWDIPSWSGGEASSYDIVVTLPDGRRFTERRHFMLRSRTDRGSWQIGDEARIQVTANYKTPAGDLASSAKTELVCYVGPRHLLTITPNSVTREYGGTDDLSYTVSGLKEGHALSDVLTGALSREHGDGVGTYAFSLDTMTITPAYARKYRLPDSLTVSYTITPKPATYTASRATKVYDGTTRGPTRPGGSFAAGDIIAGDEVTVESEGSVYASADVGTNIAITGYSLAGADAGNYRVTFDVEGNITRRAITRISDVTVNARAPDGTTDATFDTGRAKGNGVLPSQLTDFRSGGLQVTGAFPKAALGSHELKVTYSLRDHGSFKASNYALIAARGSLSGEITGGPRLRANTVWAATLTVGNGDFPGCDNNNRSAPCSRNLSTDEENSWGNNHFTYKGNTYYITRLFLNHQGHSRFRKSIKLEFSELWIGHAGVDWDTNLQELALRIDDEVYGDNDDDDDEAFLSISDGITMTHVPFVTWKKDGLSWASGEKVHVSLEVLDPAPTNVTVTPGDRQLTVSWTPPAGTKVTGYDVKYFDPSYGNFETGWLYSYYTGTDPEHTITNLTNGRQYVVQVRVKDSDGQGAWAYPSGLRWCLGYIGIPSAEPQPDGPPQPETPIPEAEPPPAVNTAPVAAPIPDAIIVNESGAHEASLSGVFTDADGDELTITASSSNDDKATVAVDADQSALTVSARARGAVVVRVTADDGRGGAVSVEFNVRVKSAPIVASPLADVSDLPTGNMRQISLTGVFSDADGDALTITAASSDNGKAVVTVAADQSGLTVTGAAVGAATITVTARDTDGNSVSDAFDVSVIKRQTKPLAFGAAASDAVYTAGTPATGRAGPTTARRARPHSLPEASGGVGEVIYTATGLPTGLALSQDLLIRGVPEAATASPATVTYTATDEEGSSVSLAFRVTVNPAVTLAGAQLSKFTNAIIEYTVGQDAALHFAFPEASGGTGALTYHLTNREADVSINDYAIGFTFDPATRVLSSKVGNDQPVAGQRYALTYWAEDEWGSLASAFGSIEVNEAPTLPEIADMSFTVDSAVSVTLPDADGGSTRHVNPRYTLEPQVPGISFYPGNRDAGTRILAGAPTAPGTTAMTYTVTDRNGVTDTATFTITVSGPPNNNPPTVSGAIPDATIINESGTHRASLSGVFADADGDYLTVRAASSDESVAIVAVHPDYSALTVTAKRRGTATVTIGADDGNGGSVSDTFTVTVKAAPVVASPIADISGLEAEDSRVISMSGVFSDADGDTVTVIRASSSDSAIAAVTAAIDGSTSAITGITVTGVSEGTTTITVTAQDSDGNRVSDAFDVTVNAASAQQQVNNSPTVSSAIADATIVNETGTHRVTLSGVFSDADGDDLTFKAASSAESVATVAVSADYSSLTVTAKARGTATVTVTASDGNGGTVEDAFIVTVKAAPVVVSPIGDVSELEVEATNEFSLSGVFNDADGDNLTVTAATSDEGKATVSASADQSVLTVSGVAEGKATITVTAQDADGNSVSDAFDVTVVGDTGSQFYDGNPVPGPVTDLQLTVDGVTLIVSWSAPGPDSGGEVRGYIVHVRPEGGENGSGRTKTPKAKKTKVSFDNLEAGRTYRVWVRAENEAGKGERVRAGITLPEAEPPPDQGAQGDGQQQDSQSGQ